MKHNLREDIENTDADKKAEALAKYLDLSVDDITKSKRNKDVYRVSTDADYIVCDYDRAYELASEDIRKSFDEMGLDAFNKDFQEYVIEYCINKNVFDDIVQSDIESINDDRDDDEIMEIAEDKGLIENSKDEYTDEEIQHLRDTILEQDLNDSNDSIEYLKDNYGEDYILEFINDCVDMGDDISNLVDIDKLVAESIHWDGIASFIAKYDQKEIKLSDDLYAYRID